MRCTPTGSRARVLLLVQQFDTNECLSSGKCTFNFAYGVELISLVHIRMKGRLLFLWWVGERKMKIMKITNRLWYVLPRLNSLSCWSTYAYPLHAVLFLPKSQLCKEVWAILYFLFFLFNPLRGSRFLIFSILMMLL